jgi:hypothetical protein
MSEADKTETGIVKFDNDEFRMRDVDVARRLEFKEPRAIRKLIKRHKLELQEFGDLPMRDTVSRIEKTGAIRGIEERKYYEYWLNKDQITLISVLSEQPNGTKLAVAIIKDINALTAKVKELEQQLAGHIVHIPMVSRFLLESAKDWELLWATDVREAVGRVYGWKIKDTKFPVYMGNIIGKIYDIVIGKELMDEARKRQDESGGHDSALLHQFFTDEMRELFKRKLDTVWGIAKLSRDPNEFWGQMCHVFKQDAMQMVLFDAPGFCTKCGAPSQPDWKVCAYCGKSTKSKRAQ